MSVLRRGHVLVEPDTTGFDDKLKEQIARKDPGGKAGKQIGGQLNRALKRLDLPVIDVKADPKQAFAAIEATELKLKELARDSATVEVKVQTERALSQLKRFKKQLGDEDGSGGKAAEEFATHFSGRIGPLLAKAPVGPAVIAAAVAAAPAIGAVVSAAVIGGAGVGGVIGGLLLVKDDPRVEAAGKALGENLLGQLKQDAAPFVQPLLIAIGKIEDRFGAMNGRIQHIFDTSSGFLQPLVDGALHGVEEILGGVDSLVSEGRPVIQALGDSFTIIGHSVGDALKVISGGSEESASALTNLARIVGGAIEATGYLVRGLTELYGIISFIPGKLQDVSYWGGQFVGVVKDSDKAAAGAAGSTYDWAAAVVKGGDAAAGATDKARVYIATEKDVKVVQDELTQAQEAYTRTLQSMGGATGFAAKAADGLRQANENLHGAAIAGTEANEAYEASWDDLSGAISANGRSLNIHTAAGRANRDALQALLQKNNELYFADIAAGISVDKARTAHEKRTKAVEREADKLDLNKKATKDLIGTYGQIPKTRETDLILDGVRGVIQALQNLYIYQRSLATGKSIASIEQTMRTGSDSGPAKRHGGFHTGGYTGDGGKYEPAGVVHGKEWVLRSEATTKLQRNHPGLLQEMNATGSIPGYAKGGQVAPIDTSRRWPFHTEVGGTRIPSRAEVASKVAPSFGPWPSSPSAQRGDSGVWRSVVRLIKGTGPLSGRFGNAYRPGDPLWHGCVPMDTRILTRRGWITYDEVVVGQDETIGYNPATGKNEWTLILGLHHYENAEVWQLQNSWFTAEVTPGHKWLVDQPVTVQTETTCTECGREFATGRGMTTHRGHAHGVLTPRRERYEEQLVATRDFKQNTRIHLAKPADLGEQLPISDDEAELIGWIFGDGYMEPFGPTIVQSKPDQVEYLRGFMSRFACSEYVRQPEGRQNFTIFRWKLAKEYWDDLASRSKACKADALNFVFSLSPSQREAFVRGFLSADGTRDPRTQKEHLGYAAFQVSGPVAEAIKVAAYLEGYRPDTRVKTEFDANRFGTQPLEHIGFRTPIAKNRHLPIVAKRTADVWCPTTTLGTWTARQGEEIFLTGNSGRAVDWMGFNQDRLASFLAARRPLELIHRTKNRDYAYTRGVNKGSFNNGLMEAHRNHIHIAMDDGGMRVLQPGLNIIPNGTGRPEPIAGPAAMAAMGGNTYQITVNVAVGAHPAEVGRQIVDKIQAFEQSNGNRWRKDEP